MVRWRVRLCVVLLAVFWVLVAVGGVVNDGYRQYVDFVSSLAARGVEQQWIGVAALWCAALAHLVVVPDLWRRDRWVGWAVLASGVFLIVVASFPIQCTSGLYCAAVAPARWLDTTHVVGVLGYSITMVIAMVRAGLIALRIPRWRSWGVGSLVTAAVFTVALALTQGASPGLSQRFWVLAGQVWLVLAASIPFSMRVGTERSRERVVQSDRDRGGFTG